MTKEEAIKELEYVLYYWTRTKFYNNKIEQEALEFAINYMKDE